VKFYYLPFKLHLDVNDLPSIEHFPKLSKIIFKSTEKIAEEITRKINNYIKPLGFTIRELID